MPSSLPSGTRIAVVDDDQILLDYFSSTMHRMGYKSYFFPSPDDALSEISSRPGHFSLVISDLQMPGMDGLQFLEKLRRAEPDIPVILMTGSDLPGIKEAVEKMGKAVFLEKPFAINSVLSDLVPRLIQGKI